MDISVIIPVRDQAASLRVLLSGIRDKDPAGILYEIIVVDDGSHEDIGAVCREYDARHLRLEESRGPAHARNTGAAEAVAPILFFLDGDVEYAEGLFERAKAELDADSELQAVSFINQAWCKEDGIVKNFGAAIEHYWFQKMMGGESLARIQGFTTRNGAIRKSAFDAIDGFDTSFETNAHEDYDFGKRLFAHFEIAMADAPLPYHNFPDRLSRVVRNYFVRTSLFVPYFIRNRPPMDKAQTSGSEAVVRLVGFALFVMIAGFFFYRRIYPGYPPPAKIVLLFLLFYWLLLILYGYLLNDFKKKLDKWSGSRIKAGTCLLIHWLTSVVIVAGGMWGLLRYILERISGMNPFSVLFSFHGKKKK